MASGKYFSAFPDQFLSQFSDTFLLLVFILARNLIHTICTENVLLSAADRALKSGTHNGAEMEKNYEGRNGNLAGSQTVFYAGSAKYKYIHIP